MGGGGGGAGLTTFAAIEFSKQFVKHLTRLELSLRRVLPKSIVARVCPTAEKQVKMLYWRN